MKSNTNIVMGLNNVGDSKDRPEIFDGTFSESIIHIAKWISTRSIAKRIDIVFARSEEEARHALRLRETAATSKSIDSNSLMETIKEIMGEQHAED